VFCSARFEISIAFLQTFLRDDAVWLGEQFLAFQNMVVCLSSRPGVQGKVYFSRKNLLCLHQWRDGQDMQHVYLIREIHFHRVGRLHVNTATSTECTKNLY
jgi:hypothetical protein